MKHANVAIFVPHTGCPQRCAFCNQNVISGAQDAPTPEEVEGICKKALGDLKEREKNSEIAFFGGSFTAIERSYMTALLDAALKYVGEEGFSGIRISTRPDCIDEEILVLLKEKKVTSIELGAQSMDDGVLQKNRRGHTSDDTVRATILIKQYGFSLGVQMMTGLYGDTRAGSVKTAKKLASLAPDTARVYPTVVLRDTYLAKLYESGEYNPDGLNEAIETCCDILDIFEKANVRVIRLGLHASEFLQEQMVAGAYHPALRQLCESERICRNIQRDAKSSKINVICNPKRLSDVLGQKRENIEKLRQQSIEMVVSTDENIEAYTVLNAEE